MRMRQNLKLSSGEDAKKKDVAKTLAVTIVTMEKFSKNNVTYFSGTYCTFLKNDLGLTNWDPMLTMKIP